jgi:hypothetical protein
MATTIRYNSNEYEIADLEYPTDLQSEGYGGHRVVFLINVADESKFRAYNGGSDVYDIPAGEITKTAGQRTADKASEALGEVEKYAKSKGVNVELKPTAFTKRLKAAISLYVPNDLTFSYSTAWGEADLAKSENILDTFNKIVDSNSIGEGISNIATGVIRKGLSNFRSTDAVVNATQQTPGNSKVEQLFQGVDFRTFTFTYDFAPRNEKEAINVMNIISMFKHHMLPEFKDNDQFLFIFPSQFEIKYYKGSTENEFLDKHFTAICTNCSVNYTANGQFSTFANGMPTHIRMNLTFKEIVIPTKETTPSKFGEKSYKDWKKDTAIRTDRVRGGQ